METYKCFKKLSLNILIRFNVKCVQIIQKIANSRQYRVFEDDVSHSSYKVFLVNLLRPFFLHKLAVIYTIKKNAQVVNKHYWSHKYAHTKQCRVCDKEATCKTKLQLLFAFHATTLVCFMALNIWWIVVDTAV